MRQYSGIVISVSLIAALGCGSTHVAAPNNQQVTSTSVNVTMQIVRPVASTQVAASATSAYPIAKWQIYVDNALVFNKASSASQITQSISLDAGTHQISVHATNSSGTSGSASTSVTVPAQSTSATPSSVLAVTMQPIGSKSPAQVVASAQASNPITGWAIYVDSALVFHQNTSASKISESVAMSDGKHQVIARVWDNTGAYASATATVDIQSASSNSSGSDNAGTSASSLIPTPPSSAKYFSNIDQMSGWIACSACANSGTATSYWFKQGVGSPSLDGSSMETYIKGSSGTWADDLFVKKFGDQTWARHIEFSMNFLWNAPQTKQSNGAYVVQAIEFDARMLIGDFKYLFGTQCNYGHGTWDIWSNTGRSWQHTSIPCQKWGPNSWHKMTWYFTIDDTNKYLHYVALEVDGVQYSVNKAMAAGSVPSNKEFLIQFEQDTDQNGDPWYLWADKVQVALW